MGIGVVLPSLVTQLADDFDFDFDFDFVTVIGLRSPTAAPPP